MSITRLDLTHLSPSDARFLNGFLKQAETEKDKQKKCKWFVPGVTYTYKKTHFQISHSLVRRTKTKKDKFGQETKTFIYSVYSEENKLGSGNYGSVYPVLGKLKHIKGGIIYYAIDRTQIKKRQVIKKQDNNFEQFKNENKLARRLPETKTKKLTTVYKDDKKAAAFAVMQEWPGVDFVDTIYSHPYTSLQRLLLSINALNALKNIDDGGVIQRDIKPENMKVDHDDHFAVRIFDFGLGRKKSKKDNQIYGTDLYMSPELLYESEDADESSDVYSMGLVLRELWRDQSTLDNANEEIPTEEMLKKRVQEYLDDMQSNTDFEEEMMRQWQHELPMITFNPLEDILLKMTAPRPENRASIHESLEVFQSILLKVPMRAAFENDEPSVIVALLKEGVKPDYDAFADAVSKGQWECVNAFIEANPESIKRSRCVKAYSNALLAAARGSQTELVNKLIGKGVKEKERAVYEFLISPEFAALEAYLPDTKDKDEKPRLFWDKVKKYDTLQHFVEALKACVTMQEVEEAFNQLERSQSRKNPYPISDFNTLNAARGGMYRLFGKAPTTISHIKDLKKLLPQAGRQLRTTR